MMVVRLNESLSNATFAMAAAKEEVVSISDDEDSDESSSYESSVGSGANGATMEPTSNKRKRQRLTHLTPEEKTMRRKLKNRVAAQSARDRKKAHMDTLEEQVAKLSEQNNKLTLENSLLKEKARLLGIENQSLKQKLASSVLPVTTTTTATTNTTAATRIVSAGVERSAESSHVTQPKVLLQLCQFKSSNSISSSSNNSVRYPSIRGPSDVQSLLQKLVLALLIHLSGLIRACDESSHHNSSYKNTRQYQQLVSIRAALTRLDSYMTCHRLSLVKLKQTLIKLLKLARIVRYSRWTPTSTTTTSHQLQQLVRDTKSQQQHQHAQQSFKMAVSEDKMRLCMLISFMASNLTAKKKKPN